MALRTAYHFAPTGGTYYAFPAGTSFANWLSARIQLVESAGPNTGSYSASLDDAVDYVVFSGSNQPTGWDQGVAYILSEDVNGPSLRAQLGMSAANLDDRLDAIPTVTEIEAALLNEGDGQQLIDAILTVINNNLDLPALELTAIANAVRSELAPELSVSTKLNTMLESDGAGGFQFTTAAVENAPGSGGGESAAAILAAFKSDTVLGTGAGGLVSNVVEIGLDLGKVPKVDGPAVEYENTVTGAVARVILKEI